MDPQSGRLLSQDPFAPRTPNSSFSLHSSLATTMRNSCSTTSSGLPHSRQNSQSVGHSTDFGEAMSRFRGAASPSPRLSTSTGAEGGIGNNEAVKLTLEKQRSVSMTHALKCIEPLPAVVEKEETDGGKRRKLKEKKVKDNKPKIPEPGPHRKSKKADRSQKKGTNRLKATFWKAREWLVWGM